ncbi:competence protein ComK [Sutcliffiella deserti]|uniref:competence protein ComK n=1 Tax=Sutcliffiella deserti TaxID=2875501 RepID=UPI001CC16C8C|nr:competence protein ComK [Sutcliffiella deserti]
MNIISEYTISHTTIAILPNLHPEYQTMIIDMEGIFYTKDRSGVILNRSCLKYGASYDGRKEAATHLTNYVQKTPILISEVEGIIALPTHSPEHEDCAWILYHQIKEIKPSKRTCCMIKFHNYTELEVKISSQTMRQQIQKASVIYSIFCTEQRISYSFVVEKGRRNFSR